MLLEGEVLEGVDPGHHHVDEKHRAEDVLEEPHEVDEVVSDQPHLSAGDGLDYLRIVRLSVERDLGLDRNVPREGCHLLDPRILYHPASQRDAILDEEDVEDRLEQADLSHDHLWMHNHSMAFGFEAADWKGHPHQTQGGQSLKGEGPPILVLEQLELVLVVTAVLPVE